MLTDKRFKLYRKKEKKGTSNHLKLHNRESAIVKDLLNSHSKILLCTCTEFYIYFKHAKFINKVCCVKPFINML